MHSHTTPALLAATDPAEFFNAVGISSNTLLMIAGISIAASFFGTWLASTILLKPRATAGRAALTLVSQTAFSVVFLIVWAVGVAFLSRSNADGPLVVIVMIGAFLVFLFVTVAIPMQIYEIGVWRSIGFILLSAVIAGTASNIATMFVAGPLGLDKIPARLIAFAKARQEALQNPYKDFAQRQAELQRRYQQLEIRRRYLPANDHRAFAEYERDRAVYQRDLDEFKAEFPQ